MASLSESSLKQYNNSLKKWWMFCKDKNLLLHEAQISDIIQFLTQEFDSGASYGSLNNMRSAISLILGPDVGHNALLKRFFKGVSILRSPRPKYESTWDPKIVLDYFRNWRNVDLSLELLGKKLVTLLALVTGQRIQTLSLIDVKNVAFKENAIEIKIPERIKTSGIGKTQPLLQLPFFNENPNICPVLTLQCYLRQTESLRTSTSLFISFKKPFQKVSTQSLSRWIKEILCRSGIDTSLFTAYSTRHASTSAAKRAGLNIDIIRKSAGWTEKSHTFARFYDRPVVSDEKSFGLAILDS